MSIIAGGKYRCEPSYLTNSLREKDHFSGGSIKVGLKRKLVMILFAQGSGAMESFNFDAEVTRILPSLRGYANRYANKYHDADDLLQEAATKAFKNREQFEPGTNLKAWLTTILFHIAISSIRRRAKRECEMAEGQAERIPTEASAEHRLALTQMMWLIGELPVEQAEALRLRAFDGLTYEQIADKLGIQVGTVKSRVSRARAALRSANGLADEDSL